MTTANVLLQGLGFTAADLAHGLCPEVLAYLERCAETVTVDAPTGWGVGRCIGRSESRAYGAGGALRKLGASL